MIPVELEYVGMHAEKKDVTGYFKLCIEVAPVCIFHLNPSVNVSKLAVYIFGKFLKLSLIHI